ncbi:hypothetical protein EPZ47_27610 [Pseudomonas viciae]|uniref:Uncharacterized protein n=1 Tax=Pseudomonas viciae TaxID=2505979 RepID=A0A4P7PQS7_9PSED|nr:hypothetical protein EPZ47_27610 [Pseudomonas viciae]
MARDSGLSNTPSPPDSPRQKNPRSSRDWIGAGALLEELSREGDQTIVIQLGVSVPSPGRCKLAENDALIVIHDIATICPCRRFGRLPESRHDPNP